MLMKTISQAKVIFNVFNVEIWINVLNMTTGSWSNYDYSLQAFMYNTLYSIAQVSERFLIRGTSCDLI